jgi:DNA repair protein RadD
MAYHELRDYQEAGIANLRTALAEGHNRIMFQLPTGAGKTATAASIIRSAIGKGKTVIFTVPALSLITQTIESFRGDDIYDIGVMQGNHEMTDADQPVQICSVQTLTRRKIPKADLVIIDEAHVVFKLYEQWFNDPEWANVPIIGLSATPWTKGLGKLYSKLVIGTTTQELIDKEILSPFRAFAPSHVDLSNVKTVAGDYDLEELGDTMNKPKLVADIVETWLTKAEYRPTLVYAVNRAHAANIADAFNKAGIPCGYMDGTTPIEDRDIMCNRFRRGELRIIANVGVLTTGVDLPFVSCLVLARPTKSEMLYVQIMGRGLRRANGKTDCMILDHSDTTLRLGFVTDIHHTKLNTGKKDEASKSKERDEPLPKECPSCTFLKPARLRVCPNCGFEPKAPSNVVNIDGTLAEVKGKGKNKTYEGTLTPFDEQEKYYRELKGIAKQKGYKSGWAYHQFKDRFKVSPNDQFIQIPLEPSLQTINYVKHAWIKRRKAVGANNWVRK